MRVLDTENKLAWCVAGEIDEIYFVNQVAPDYGLNLSINPEKDKNKYATDFVVNNANFDADLKHIQTPFFKSGVYGYNPSYTVTLNHKDYLRYSNKYAPEWSSRGMVILFWVQWEKQSKYGVTVDPVEGLWSLRISELDTLVRSGRARCHEYQKRQDGAGSNAKSSWLIDLRLCTRIPKS